MTTRSLSVAKTGRSLNSFNSSPGIADLALLYYENPTGKVSALCQESYYADRGEGIQEWIDITSQDSKSLPSEFRNAPDSASGDNSKTLDESLVPNIFALSAPFASQAENETQGSGIEANFFSPNASSFEFQYNIYSASLSDAGSFIQRKHFVF